MSVAAAVAGMDRAEAAAALHKLGVTVPDDTPVVAVRITLELKPLVVLPTCCPSPLNCEECKRV